MLEYTLGRGYLPRECKSSYIYLQQICQERIIIENSISSRFYCNLILHRKERLQVLKLLKLA